MKKMILMPLFCLLPLYAEHVFDKVCVPCHVQKGVSLQKTFMNALLVYGGKENMKAGLAYYFRNPSVRTSVMDEDFLKKNGLKVPMQLSKKMMEEALDQYWQIYTVMGKLQ